MPIPAVIALLVVSGLAIGAAFVTASLMKRQLQRRKIATFRRQAQAHQTSFDARDEQTLV